MALQEQYRNKMKPLKPLITLCCSAFLLCCNQEAVQIPNIYFSHNDTALHIINGIAYFHDSLYSGHVVDTYNKTDTALSMSYYNGKEEGVYKQWYCNKQLAAERYFENGRKEQLHRGWWQNGKPKFEYHFLNDEYEGEVKEWNSDGFLYKIFHYSKGHENGSEKMWWEDGRIRANYVVKDDERFGLTGQKLCKNNLTDSIFK
jgi:antitoxin component YwqK of YwqJK toxin-antitoxin module